MQRPAKPLTPVRFRLQPPYICLHIFEKLEENNKMKIQFISNACAIFESDAGISLKENKIKLTSAQDSKGDLFCSLDSRLLRRILDRSSHWNNAEIVCHVGFKRSPNYYSPDIHTMLQFLHL